MKLRFKSPFGLKKYFSLGAVPKILLLPIVLVFLIGLFIARPFVIVQTYPIDWQFAHLISMTHANELRNRKWNVSHRRKKVTIYCIDGPVANKYLIRNLQRSIWICNGTLAWLLNRFSSLILKNKIYYSFDRDFGTNFENDPLIKFTLHEQKSGENFIRAFQPIVCLNVRDLSYNKYFRELHGLGLNDWKNRNSDIQLYREAAGVLAENGFSIFRMGAKVEELFDYDNPKVIDYACNGMRTEFLDLFLGRECHFAISTGSGWDEIPTIFRRPLLLVNHYDPLMTISKKCIVYPKMFFDKKYERPLSLSETIELHLSGKTNEKYFDLEEFGIEIRDMSSNELVEVVREMVQRVDGSFVETAEQRTAHLKINNILENHPLLNTSQMQRSVKSQFASSFLARYPNFCE